MKLKNSKLFVLLILLDIRAFSSLFGMPAEKSDFVLEVPISIPKAAQAEEEAARREEAKPFYPAGISPPAPYAFEPKIDPKIQQDRFWNYLTVDSELQKAFTPISVTCSKIECQAKFVISVTGSPAKLRQYLHAHPEFNLGFTLEIVKGRSVYYFISTKKLIDGKAPETKLKSDATKALKK